MVTEAFALQMSFVAIGWQVYSISGNALDLGLLGLAEFLPLLLLALPAGQLADRVPRRHLLAFMMLANLVVLGGLLAVTVAGHGTRLAVLRARVPAGGRQRDRRAGRAGAHAVARPEEILVSALAQRSIAFQLSAVTAPAVGGLLLAIRAELVYIVAIVLALIALGCVLALRSGREPATEGAAGLDEVLAGVRLIRRTNVLLGAISLDLFAVLLGGAVALLPIFAKDILDVGPTGLGLLRASPAVGALVARRRHRPPPDPASRGAVALRGRRRLRAVDGRLRPLALAVAVDARAGPRGGARHGERRPSPDDPPARHAGRAARDG